MCLDFSSGKGTLTSVWRMDFNQLFIFYSFPVEKCYHKIGWFRDQSMAPFKMCERDLLAPAHREHSAGLPSEPPLVSAVCSALVDTEREISWFNRKRYEDNMVPRFILLHRLFPSRRSSSSRIFPPIFMFSGADAAYSWAAWWAAFGHCVWEGVQAEYFLGGVTTTSRVCEPVEWVDWETLSKEMGRLKFKVFCNHCYENWFREASSMYAKMMGWKIIRENDVTWSPSVPQGCSLVTS